MSVDRRVTYRLYPSASQAEAMWRIHEAHCALYNAALQERCDAWRKQRLSIGFADQCKSWTVIRREHEEFAQLNAQSGQVTLKRLNCAFGHFFRRVKLGQKPGYPRFKSKFRFPGWGYKSHGDGFRFTPRAGGKHGVLHLSGVGKMGARGRARTPGEIVTADIKRDARGWLLSVVMRCDPQRESGARACGLDWGVNDLATLAYADGKTQAIPNERLFRAQQEKAAERQREASKSLRGKRSKRAKAKHRQIARRHAKLAAQRKDRAHKLSARLVRHHALIVTEELTIANMTRSAKGTLEEPGKNVAQKAGLNREILDTAPGMLMQMLRYKAEEALRHEVAQEELFYEQEVVPNFLAILPMQFRKRNGVKRKEKPKVKPNHLVKSGKAKIGRVNESESSYYAPLPLVAEMMDDTAILGQWTGTSFFPVRGHQDPGVQKAPTPIVSLMSGTWKPRWSLPLGSKRTARNAESSAGMGSLKSECRSSKDTRRDIDQDVSTCRIGLLMQIYPRRKAADVDLVSYPKSEAKIEYRGAC